MLQHFAVLQSSHPNGCPHALALLLVDNVPYAWVDTIKNPKQLTLTLVPHGKEIDRPSVAKAVKALTGTQPSAQALRDHLIDLAHEKLHKRQASMDKKGLKYRSSSFAQVDVAIASRPFYGTESLLLKLEAARLERDPEQYDDGIGLEGYISPAIKAKFTWPNYSDPSTVKGMCEQVSGGHLMSQAIVGTRVADGIKAEEAAYWKEHVDSMDRRRLRSSRSRLTYLMEEVERLHAKTQGKRKLYAHQIKPRLLNCASPEEFATMDREDQDTFLAELHDWILYGFFDYMCYRHRAQAYKLDGLHAMRLHSGEPLGDVGTNVIDWWKSWQEADYAL